MQSRVTFNAGELAPELSCRADIDQYTHGCSKLENWEVSELGGLKRRRGMRQFAEAMSSNGRLVPYVYTYADVDNMRFLVEVGSREVRVLDYGGSVVADFKSGNVGFDFNVSLDSLNWLQVNKLLFLTSLTSAPMTLQFDGSAWKLELWKFKNMPWRYNHETRDDAVVVKTVSGLLQVELPDTEAGQLPNGTDYLRVSTYVDEQESGWKSASILDGVNISPGVPNAATVGSKWATFGETRYEYYTCIEAWQSGNNYVAGLESPANYTGNFRKATEYIGDFDSVTPVASISGKTYQKGDKVKLIRQSWNYWTCVKAFTKVVGKDRFEDYPENFIEGIPASEALPCQGSWSFYCSGLWYGEYKVRRNFEHAEITADGWETRGVSKSSLSAAANVQCNGTETDAECYLRLFLTKSWCLDASSLAAGFIQDSCNNRLIVSQYKHDDVLKLTWSGGSSVWARQNKIWFNRDIGKSYDWSWAAFSERYGYPTLAAIFQQRLVFAGTKEQPQTLWFSRVDDLDNFLTGTVDDAAMYLTLNTMSQNPICWMKAQGSRLMLGTSESEFAIGNGQSGAGISNKNAMATDHSHVGSDGITALAVIDKVLFVERGAGRVYEFGYNLETDGYLSRDLSVLAPHISQEHGGFLRSTLIRKPNTSAVFAMDDGQVAVCTYNAHEQVKAWHRWVTNGKVIDVCGMPDGRKADRLFLLVRRGESVNIEVIDTESEYIDNGNSDYVSLMVTNPLNNPLERNEQKQNDTSLKIKFGKPYMYEDENIMISPNGGEDWNALSIHDGQHVAGWLSNRTNANYAVDKQIGIKVSGNYAVEILAIQA